jgi:putative addiction module component (TIGR02574 family)
MSKISIADLLDLSVAERIQLAEDIWDTIPKAGELPKLTDAQRAELDRRLDAHRKNPEAGSPWEDVKARILGRL